MEHADLLIDVKSLIKDKYRNRYHLHIRTEFVDFDDRKVVIIKKKDRKGFLVVPYTEISEKLKDVVKEVDEE